jgi:hypothetical protein
VMGLIMGYLLFLVVLKETRRQALFTPRP